MLKKINCDNCSKEFERENREVKRSLKKGMKQYCSVACSSKVNYKNLTAYRINPNKPFVKRNRKINELSHFNRHIRRTRGRGKEVNIDAEYLKLVWEKQNGVCPYSGIKMEELGYSGKQKLYKVASLDRIDSKKGYIKGNVQFVVTCLNHMKGTLSHEETISLCKEIAKFHNKIN